jgi:hypothetical protein
MARPGNGRGLGYQVIGGSLRPGGRTRLASVSPAPAVPGAQAYLGARSAVPGSGDMMRDRGIPARGSRRPLILWRLPGKCPGSSGMAGAGRGSPVYGRAVSGRGGLRSGGQRLLAELAQGVVAAAGQLAGDRQGGQPGVAPVPGRGVVAVVGGGRPGGALG